MSELAEALEGWREHKKEKKAKKQEKLNRNTY